MTVKKPGKQKIAAAGGGMLLVMYAGVLEALEDLNIEVEEAAGTSAGSWFAAFAASGMRPAQIRELLLDLLPATQHLDPSYAQFMFKHGLFKFKKVEKILADNLPKTFADAEIPVAMFTAAIDTQELFEWSTKNTPDANLAASVVRSSRIPGVFQADFVDGVAHTDGGSIYNYPVDYWNDPETNDPPDNVLGVCFNSTILAKSLPPKKPSYRVFSNAIRHYAGHLSLMMKQAVRESLEDAQAPNIVLSVPRELKGRGISALSFDLGKDEVRTLMDAGREQASTQLKLLMKDGKLL